MTSCGRYVMSEECHLSPGPNGAVLLHAGGVTYVHGRAFSRALAEILRYGRVDEGQGHGFSWDDLVQLFGSGSGRENGLDLLLGLGLIKPCRAHEGAARAKPKAGPVLFDRHWRGRLEQEGAPMPGSCDLRDVLAIASSQLTDREWSGDRPRATVHGRGPGAELVGRGANRHSGSRGEHGRAVTLQCVDEREGSAYWQGDVVVPCTDLDVTSRAHLRALEVVAALAPRYVGLDEPHAPHPWLSTTLVGADGVEKALRLDPRCASPQEWAWVPRSDAPRAQEDHGDPVKVDGLLARIARGLQGLVQLSDGDTRIQAPIRVAHVSGERGTGAVCAGWLYAETRMRAMLMGAGKVMLGSAGLGMQSDCPSRPVGYGYRTSALLAERDAVVAAISSAATAGLLLEAETVSRSVDDWESQLSSRAKKAMRLFRLARGSTGTVCDVVPAGPGFLGRSAPSEPWCYGRSVSEVAERLALPELAARQLSLTGTAVRSISICPSSDMTDRAEPEELQDWVEESVQHFNLEVSLLGHHEDVVAMPYVAQAVWTSKK